jgi:hypothetical protein
MKAIWKETRWRMGLVLGGAVAVAGIFAARSSVGASAGAAAPAASAERPAENAPMGDDSPDRAALPPGHPPLEAPHDGAATRPPREEIAVAMEGEVAEVLPASRYSYLRFATPSGEAWAAVEGNSIKPGDRVRITHAIEMDGFTSPTLGRTFEKIYFGTAEPVQAR